MTIDHVKMMIKQVHANAIHYVDKVISIAWQHYHTPTRRINRLPSSWFYFLDMDEVVDSGVRSNSVTSSF